MRTIRIARFALLLCVVRAAAYGSETRLSVAVCLSLQTPDPHLIVTRAQALATRIFGQVDIPLEWSTCQPAGESSPAPIVVQLVSRPPESLVSDVLGYATPSQRHVVIFMDGIQKMPDPWAVLGHVMVHEITHVIQGVPRHSSTGMMKARWSCHELLGMWHKPLPFAAEDLDILYSRLAAQRESIDPPTLPR